MDVQPLGGITSETLATQPVAKLLDRFGNLVTTDNSTQVTVALVAGPNRPGGATAVVGGTTTVTVVGGIATFTDLTFTGATNRNYVLGFTAGSFTVNASAIQVSPAAAAYLEWITEPIAQRTGEAMATQPVLRLMDFDGNIAASTSATIVASVSIGGGYIEAGTSSQAVNGIVTFSGLTLVATPSVSQQLTFTATTASGSFAITTTNNLVVSHTTASYMVPQSPYLQGGRQGAVLPTQPKLFLRDVDVRAGIREGEDDAIETELHFRHGNIVFGAIRHFASRHPARGIGDVGVLDADAGAEEAEAAASAGRFNHGRLLVRHLAEVLGDLGREGENR
jgi:hypothetical protein